MTFAAGVPFQNCGTIGNAMNIHLNEKNNRIVNLMERIYCAAPYYSYIY